MVGFLRVLKPGSLADFGRGIFASLALIGAYKGQLILKETLEEYKREPEEASEIDLKDDK